MIAKLAMNDSNSEDCLWASSFIVHLLLIRPVYLLHWKIGIVVYDLPPPYPPPLRAGTVISLTRFQFLSTLFQDAGSLLLGARKLDRLELFGLVFNGRFHCQPLNARCAKKADHAFGMV